MTREQRLAVERVATARDDKEKQEAIEKAVKVFEPLIYLTIEKKGSSLHGDDMADLVQNARIVIYDALTKFDQSKGVEFTTYLIKSLRSSISRSEKKASKNPSGQGKKWDIENATDKFISEKGRSPDRAELAEFMGLSQEQYDYAEAMSKTVSHAEFCEETFASDSEDILFESDFMEVYSSLPEKVQTIISMRAQQYTFSEIGEAMGLSDSQVRNLLVRYRDEISRLMVDKGYEKWDYDSK